MQQEAIDELLRAIRRLSPAVTRDDEELLARGAVVSELAPGAFYLRAGCLQQRLGRIHSGLLRAYYIDRQGREITVNFIREGEFATHYNAFISREPSRFWFRCLEPTVVVDLPREHLETCCRLSHPLEHYLRLAAEQVLVQMQRRMEGFLFDDAKQRYRKFLLDNPGLAGRITQTHLASYLGIERQTLTRIRKQMLLAED